MLGEDELSGKGLPSRGDCYPLAHPSKPQQRETGDQEEGRKISPWTDRLSREAARRQAETESASFSLNNVQTTKYSFTKKDSRLNSPILDHHYSWILALSWFRSFRRF